MRKMKRSALAVMVGACLLSMSAGPVLAQSATGAVAGRANPGAQVTITQPATGYSRTVTAGSDGSYRLAQLPVVITASKPRARRSTPMSRWAAPPR